MSDDFFFNFVSRKIITKFQFTSKNLIKIQLCIKSIFYEPKHI